ncbi:MAG: hypothetical protein M1831_006577 [Alyxoria varia]|nr:MAG: hypothetical protein M1831_006577 [Alyxoria varia]
MAEESDSKLFDDLERESKEFDKDAEIDRILKAFKLNAYDVLGLHPGVPDSDIKVGYRKKSLLIHPDKTKNPRAPDAFDRLAKAQNELLDEKTRERLDEAIADARMLIIRERKWTVDSPELKEDQYLKVDLPHKAKEVLIDNELRRRKQAKAQMQEEGRQQRKEDEETSERKRKREHEQQWEATREQRIGNWRDFQKGGKGGGEGEKKTKKKKMKVLG